MAGSLPQSGVALVAQGVGGFLGDMRKARGAVDDFDGATGRASGAIGGAFSRIGSAAGAAAKLVAGALVAAGVAAGAALGSTIGVAADFEQTLNVLGATSGATQEELAAVGKRAKELGADLTLPATSATDAANVMLELSKAGFSVQESMDAAKGALQLAAAAQVDSATAAGIVAGAINAFNLEASEAVRIADLLAAGANASSASMADLGQGLQQAGFAFSAAGLPVEDLVTSLAALTNVGLTGSDAGTALKNALMRLMDPTDKAAALMADLGFSAYDAQGKMKPWPQVISELRKSLSGLTEEERNAALGNIFLSDGMKAMIPLLDLTDEELAALKVSVTEQGAAADVAGAQMQGWNGAVAGLKSQLETLQLIIGQQLLPVLTPLVQRAGEAAQAFGILTEKFFTMLPTIQSSAEPFRALMQALVILNPSLLGVVGLALRLYDAVLPLAGAFGGLNTTAGGIATVLTTLLGPLGATSGAVVTATVALLDIWKAGQQVAAILSGAFTGSVGGAGGVLSGLVNIILTTVLPALATGAQWFASNLPAAIAIGQAAFQTIGSFIMTIMPTIQGIIVGVIGLVTAIWARWGDEITTITTGAFTAIQGIIQTVLGVIQGIIAVTTALITGDWTGQMETIRAANATIWQGISKFLFGVLNVIAGFFGTSVGEIVSTWQSNFNNMKTIAETLMNRAKEAIQPALSAISGAFNSIKGAIDGAIAAVKRFIEAAAKVKVPDLITPGSPTPLERGLVGIDKAATEAAGAFSRTFAPALASAAPAVSPAAMPGAAAMAGSSSVTNSRTYSMPVYTNQSPAVLQQALAVVEALST